MLQVTCHNSSYLTVMSSLSRNWSSIDETNFSDLIAELSWRQVVPQVEALAKRSTWSSFPVMHNETYWLWFFFPLLSSPSLAVWHMRSAGSTRLSQPPWRKRERRRPSSATPRKRQSTSWPSWQKRTSRLRLQNTQTFWNNMESLSELVASGQ